MKRTIIIIGMGPGLGLGMANKFGSEGFKVGMISRDVEKLKKYQAQLKEAGIESADVANTRQLLLALDKLVKNLGGLNVLHYNAVDYRVKNILLEHIDDLTNGFKLSVGNVIEAVNRVLPTLKASKGSILLTGGGTSNNPNPDFCSISLAKAGIKNLAYQFSAALKNEDVYTGTLNIQGFISEDSPKHSPKLLAEEFWLMNERRETVEVMY